MSKVKRMPATVCNTRKINLSKNLKDETRLPESGVIQLRKTKPRDEVSRECRHMFRGNFTSGCALG